MLKHGEHIAFAEFRTFCWIFYVSQFLLFVYRAMLAQSAVMRLLSSVCPSVRDDRVPYSNTFEFFENNFMAE